jgi:hypothetical protein
MARQSIVCRDSKGWLTMDSVSVLHVPRFTIDQIAQACDRPAATIRSWITSEWLKLSEHDRPGQQGIASMLSLATVFRIATASELVHYGIKPNYALYAAMAFADSSADARDKPALKRGPAELFPKRAGETVLIVWRPLDKLPKVPLLINEAASVVLVPPNRGVPLDLFFSMAGGRARQQSIIALSCNMVCETVASTLRTSAVYAE